MWNGATTNPWYIGPNVTYAISTFPLIMNGNEWLHGIGLHSKFQVGL